MSQLELNLKPALYHPSFTLFSISDADRNKLAESNGKFAKYINKIMDVYFDYHRDAYNIKGLSQSRLNQEMSGCY